MRKIGPYRSALQLVCLGLVIGSVAGCFPLTSCVAEGTRISTPNGLRSVESLQAGDAVWTMSPTGEREPGVILAVSAGTTSKIVTMSTASGNTLHCTEAHLIATITGWTKAGDLAQQETIATERGYEDSEVGSLTASRSRVYDISVSPNQNYFANGFLVHNKTVREPAQEADLHGPWILRGTDQKWYRFDLREGGQGTLAMAMVQDMQRRTFESKSVEFVSWKLDEYDIEIRVRRSNGDLSIMRGTVSASVRISHSFILDGILVERPDHLLHQLRAIDVQSSQNR